MLRSYKFALMLGAAICAASGIMAQQARPLMKLHAAVDLGAATSVQITRGPFSSSSILPQFLTGNRLGIELGLSSLAFLRAETSSVLVSSSAYDKYGERYRGYMGLSTSMFLGYLSESREGTSMGGLAGGGFILARDNLSGLDRLAPFYAVEIFLIFPIVESPLAVRLALPLRLIDFQSEGGSVEVGATLSARLSL